MSDFVTIGEFSKRMTLRDIKRRWRNPRPLVFGKKWRLKQRIRREINDAWFGRYHGPWFDRPADEVSGER